MEKISKYMTHFSKIKLKQNMQKERNVSRMDSFKLEGKMQYWRKIEVFKKLHDFL